MSSPNSYVIRRASEWDAYGVRRLAELDSQSPPIGPWLIGEIDGRPAAALSLADGRAVADPFQRTAELITMLRLRAYSLLRQARARRISRAIAAAAALQPAAGRAHA